MNPSSYNEQCEKGIVTSIMKRLMGAIGSGIKGFLKKEVVFTVAVILAIVSVFFVPLNKQYLSYPDYRVLALLFCLMLNVAGIKEQGIFRLLGEKLTAHVKKSRQLELVLVALCFFSSMLITNDVALITFVPFTLELLLSAGLEKKIIKVVVLQTIAANLGSMLTPVGNPQNLYLYSLTGVGLGEFIMWMLPLTVMSMFLLAIVTLLGKDEPVVISAEINRKTPNHFRLLLLVLLFVICMGTVIRMIPWQISFVLVCVAGIVWFRNLFREVDYCLLGTFLGFFIFVGNMQNIPAVSSWVARILQGRELWVAAGASQIISNVPAAMLLSGFTGEYKALLYGVDIGGLGTLIASLASLISYKFYCNSQKANKGKYMLIFTLWNLVFLAVLLPLASFFLS